MRRSAAQQQINIRGVQNSLTARIEEALSHLQLFRLVDRSRVDALRIVPAVRGGNLDCVLQGNKADRTAVKTLLEQGTKIYAVFRPHRN